MERSELPERLQLVIRQSYGVESTHVATVYVWEALARETVWEGVVEVFELRNHPTAKRCYAWADRHEQLAVVLETLTIQNASEAIAHHLQTKHS